MQKVVTNHSVAVLRALTPEELDALCVKAALVVQEAKQSADFNKASNPSTGKLICVLEERLNEAKTAKHIASNTSLAKYWEGITKTKMPNHAMTCAVAFGTFVRTEQIDEKTYDLNSANCIELAGAISNAVNGEIAHPAIAKAAAQLKERGKDEAKNLRAILKEVKPPKAMTPEDAQELLQRIFDDGHLKLAIAGCAAEMCYLEGDEAKDSYFALIAAGTLVDKHFGEQTDAWMAAYGKAQGAKVATPEDVNNPALVERRDEIAANVAQMQAAA
jgi:hypothetical protein